ncbi:OpgC domain-containing protein [Pseudooceanicola algae]|uniref:Uncharacterized protein n=1 Tax=Pseudooceanicola algae TaxID=1537215 RepID=A0A418SCJ1_9RHOB|nr:OpgC domain-containing protein [Pseudooceanicola algae]QPM89021.1 hypothetical protein PSAL_002300 [Pseudooceanicola algae]
MKRIDFLDGLRGFFLLTMVLSHLVLQNGVWVQKLHFREVMFVESTQGFVFLSGLMFGLFKGRQYLRSGMQAMRKSVHARMLELWLWTVALIFLGLAMRDLLPGGVMAWRNWLGTAPMDDPIRILGILTLAFQPTFLDILQMYILFMAISPLLIRWVFDGRWMLAAGLSALVWTACQLQVSLLWSRGVDRLFEASDTQGLRMAFDPMGWQVPFIAGLMLGAAWAAGRIRWEEVFGPRTRDLALVALLFLLLFAPLRLASAHGWMPEAVFKAFRPFELRSNFGPVYLLNFMAAGFLFTWLAIGGRNDPSAIVRAISNGIGWIFTRPALCLLGRHSLQVYLWHVVLVYGVRYIDSTWGPGGQAANTLLALTTMALLWVPPLWRERNASRARA